MCWAELLNGMKVGEANGMVICESCAASHVKESDLWKVPKHLQSYQKLRLTF